MHKILFLCFYLFLSLKLWSINTVQYDNIYHSLKNYSPDKLDVWGEKHYQAGSLDTALVCFSIVSGGYTPDSGPEERRMYSHAFNRCGVIYVKYSSYSKALNMFLKALDICNDSAYCIKVYNNIGTLYCLFRDYKTAENYCRKAYEMSLEYEDQENRTNILSNLIGINYYLQDYDKVKMYSTKLKELNPLKTSLYHYYLCCSQGALMFMQKKYESSLRAFKKSLAYADGCEDSDRLKYVSFSHISKCFSFIYNQDSALYYMKRGEKVALKKQYTDLLSECYADISSIYGKMGDEKHSLRYKKMHLNIKDSLFNVQEFGRIKDMHFIYEMEKIEKQIYRLTDERTIKDNQIKSQRQMLRLTIGGLLLIGVLLLAMYLQNRKLREANIVLFNKNLEIMKSDQMLKETRKLFAPDENILSQEREQEEKEDIEAKAKYHNSVISQEEKRRIYKAILDVMDNTEEYYSASFTLDKLATLTHSKSKYVSQVINESFNKNFNMFINEYRIKEVQRRLMDTEAYGKYTIVFIAGSVGFKSDSNFNSVFKKMTGITPTAYRNMANKCNRITTG